MTSPGGWAWRMRLCCGITSRRCGARPRPPTVPASPGQERGRPDSAGRVAGAVTATGKCSRGERRGRTSAPCSGLGVRSPRCRSGRNPRDAQSAHSQRDTQHRTAPPNGAEKCLLRQMAPAIPAAVPALVNSGPSSTYSTIGSITARGTAPAVHRYAPSASCSAGRRAARLADPELGRDMAPRPAGVDADTSGGAPPGSTGHWRGS